ncbi:Tetratricopeptide repeat protein 7B [Homalodisca vitripennis]|nr:Tetratricopeptide repeat protein 7B [Homalodisca vitripennis]
MRVPPATKGAVEAHTDVNERKTFLEIAGVALDAHLLLGKLHYAMGFFEESLNHYNEADLQSLTEKALPSRSLRIVAESYAIKGLCLEKVPPSSTSKYKQVEWEEQMGRCYELAGDLTLLYLQEQDKMQQQIVTTGTFNTGTGTGGSHSPQPQDSTWTMGPIVMV